MLVKNIYAVYKLDTENKPVKLMNTYKKLGHAKNAITQLTKYGSTYKNDSFEIFEYVLNTSRRFASGQVKPLPEIIFNEVKDGN